MISPDIKFEGFDAASWTKMIGLFAPHLSERLDADPVASDAPEHTTLTGLSAPEGTLLIIVDEHDQVLRATHSLHGRIARVPPAPAGAVRDLASTYAARRVLWMRRGAMDEALERFAERVRFEDDYLTQVLTFSAVLRELEDGGALRLWPNPFGNVPIPTPAMIQGALDVALPDGKVALAVLWERGEPWTSVAVRRRGPSIDRVVGPDLVSKWTGPLGGDWRRDHVVVREAVEENLGALHIGLFTEVETFRALLRAEDSGRWARAAAVRDVSFEPMPPYLALALGADVVRAATAGARGWLAALGLLEPLAPVTAPLQRLLPRVATVTSTLGFDPVALLARWLTSRDSPGTGTHLVKL